MNHGQTANRMEKQTHGADSFQGSQWRDRSQVIWNMNTEPGKDCHWECGVLRGGQRSNVVYQPEQAGAAVCAMWPPSLGDQLVSFWLESQGWRWRCLRGEVLSVVPMHEDRPRRQWWRSGRCGLQQELEARGSHWRAGPCVGI